MALTRRDFGKLALATLPAARWRSRSGSVFAAPWADTPNSKWAGVQVGMNVPYNFGTNNMSGDEVLHRCLQLGISGVELRTQPVERFLGSPAPTASAPRGRGAQTPEQQAAANAAADTLRKWRLSAPVNNAQAFRQQYENAGVAIEIVKFDWINPLPADDLLDYCFELTKALGARALSCEMPIATQDVDTKRLGQFADKHGIMVGYHGHTAVTPAIWEKSFAYAAHNGANLDLGHFVAGNNASPIPFLKQHHDRITHMHVKDRKLHDGPNVPFGQGDTPIKEALQLVRDNKWNIQATIEFEIPGPPGPDGKPRPWTMDERMSEMAKCVEYCRLCLIS
jgi:sugar phosphate isomerase/epimerase